jgi:poly(hydroxyalkanoate) granule-associated protein
MEVEQTKDKSISHQMTDGTIDTVRQLWLAGLGAFTKAEQEGGLLFKWLVKEGEKIEIRTKSVAENQVGKIRDRMEGTLEDVKGRAIDTLDGWEQLLEDRVARILGRIGVPTQEEVQELSRRIEILTKNIQILIHKS